MFHPGLVATRDQKARADMFRDYVRSVVDNPAFVGCHYFKYTDQPLSGRPGDGENFSIGFTARSSFRKSARRLGLTSQTRSWMADTSFRGSSAC